ncbi:hypothetical protein GBAR_LOCUS10230 [Geodia barretti]|uniref:Uncharacterized protein n=1 Tax=Geodia barretti TaxID=519541 RepID=A0AA35WK33_GEOBA|nr:hypothetical protein GBAR_LOCUS10230 [Geodia barretti]
MEFWSTRNPRKLTTYTLTITSPPDEDLAPLFRDDRTPCAVTNGDDLSTSGVVVECETVTVGGEEEEEEHVWDFLCGSRERQRKGRGPGDGAPPKMEELAGKAPPRTPVAGEGGRFPPRPRGVARDERRTPERSEAPSLPLLPLPAQDHHPHKSFGSTSCLS